MAYNRQDVEKIKSEYSSKNINAKNSAEAKKVQLHAIIPELAQIDRQLNMTGSEIFAIAIEGKDVESKIAELKKKNAALLIQRKAILEKNGYPEDYTDVKYECNDCHDTGYIGIDMCHCMKKELAKAAFKSSGLGNLIKTQSFETFDLSKYLNDKSVYNLMQRVYEHAKKYANNFEAQTENLLLFGGTGLGKTHLSTAIGKVVIEKGFSVVYDSAQNIINDFEKVQFRNMDQEIVDKYFDADLLIIDDLGTEMKTAFSVSCIYNLINTRINSDKKMIINTNLLDNKSICERYDERIASRIFGCFMLLQFRGDDLRSPFN